MSESNETHYNQILNYLTAFQLEIGLLINFGENSLNFKRFINSDFR
ncbi:GxxExxY protein [Fodinibius roseus]